MPSTQCGTKRRCVKTGNIKKSVLTAHDACSPTAAKNCVLTQSIAVQLRRPAPARMLSSQIAGLSSPERQFYTLGHFPTFMPLPFGAEDKTGDDKTEQQLENDNHSAALPPSECSGQFTHSPYSNFAVPDQHRSATAVANCVPAHCRPPSPILGHTSL